MFMFIEQSRHTTNKDLRLVSVDFQLLTIIIYFKPLKVGIDVVLKFCVFYPKNDDVTYVLQYFVEDGYFICVDCV